MSAKQILIAIDQLANAIIGGWADETFSARCWRCRKQSRAWAFMRGLVDVLLWFDPGHCEASYLSELERLQSPPEERNNNNTEPPKGGFSLGEKNG